MGSVWIRELNEKRLSFSVFANRDVNIGDVFVMRERELKKRGNKLWTGNGSKRIQFKNNLLRVKVETEKL